MKRKKIALVCGGGILSGKEIMTLELSKGLRLYEMDIHILTSHWGNGDFIAQLKEAELPFDLLPFGFISATLTGECVYMTAAQMARWPELLFRYLAFLQVKQPTNVIHTNWHHLLLLLPFLRSDKDWFWVHEVVPNKRQYRVVFQLLSHRLRGFIVVSNAVGNALRSIGIPEEKIQVVHNGLKHPATGYERATCSNGIIRLGIVGQIGSWKGHQDLLEAFGQISHQWLNTELHIFGQGAKDYERLLKNRVMALGLGDRVKWHGFVTDRTVIFNTMDICIVPSRSEDPLPTVAIEAAGFGLPVIGTQRGGLPEIIEDGQTGLVVPAANPAALAAGIERLLVNTDLRLAMGEQARKRMLEHFSSQRFIKEFLALLGVPKLLFE